MRFHIQLGKHIGIENPRFGNVPDGCGLYDVPSDELLNGLILGHASGTVGAANRLQVAAALSGITIIPSFLGRLGSEEARAKCWCTFQKTHRVGQRKHVWPTDSPVFPF